MLKKISTYFIPILSLLLLASMVLPSLTLPFSLVDDSDFAQKYIATSQDLETEGFGSGVESFFTVFPGTEQGRLTPTFWTIFVTRFSVAGLNPQAHHLFHSIEVLLIFSLLYMVVKDISKSKGTALLSCLFLLLLSPGAENWYRISTQEPGQILTLLLLSLSVLKSKKFNWTIILFSILFIFSKETSFLLTPIFFIWWLFEENKKDKPKIFKSWVWMSVLSLGFLVVLWRLNINNVWAGNNASLSNILPSLKTYWKILTRLYVPQALVLSIPTVLWLGKDKQVKKVFYIFLSWTFLNFLALLPWKYSLARLTGTMMVGVAVVLSIATYLIASKSVEAVRKRGNLSILLLTGVMSLVLIKFSYVNFLDGHNFRQTYLAWEKSNGAFLKKVSTMPEDTQVIFNVSTDHFDAHEWIVMMPEYLSVFYGRDDISMNFIDEEGIEIKNGNYLAQWSVYNLPLNKKEKDLVWQVEEKANLLSVSLTQVIKKALGLNNLPVFKEKIYSWQIFEN